MGQFISEIACGEDGDAGWNDVLCGSCCPDVNNKDVVENLEVDVEAAVADEETFAPFDGQTLNLLKTKKRRVRKTVSVTTTQGAPKVLLPADVATLYRSFRYHKSASNHCCARAKTREANCIEFAFTDPNTQSENVTGGLAFLTGGREETLNMTRAEKKSAVQDHLRALWSGALARRAHGDEKVPQYFPYGALHLSTPITLCQNSFAALYDVKPNLVKNLVSNIMSGLADVNPDKKQNYGNKTTFDHVTFDDLKHIFEDEGNIPIGK